MKQLIKAIQNATTHWIHWNNNDPFDQTSLSENQYYKIALFILEKAKVFMSNNACGVDSTLLIDPLPGDYLKLPMLGAWNCTGDIIYASGPVIDEPNCLSIKFFEQELGCDEIAESRSRDPNLAQQFVLFFLVCLMVAVTPYVVIKIRKFLPSEDREALLPHNRQKKGLCDCFFKNEKTHNLSNTSLTTYGTHDPKDAAEGVELNELNELKESNESNELNELIKYK